MDKENVLCTIVYTHMCVCSHLLSCVQVCNPMDYNLLGAPVHENFQARILEWVAISFSRGSSLTQGSSPCLLHLPPSQVNSLPAVSPWKPHIYIQWILSGKKWNEVLTDATTWMNLENICYMKEDSHKRPSIVWLHLYELSRTGKSIETESKLAVA